ncbi:MurD UDP-N-acetylmuramoylalanine-D-glutamate ligase [Candidatus Nanopelagicaceae bacterium]
MSINFANQRFLVLGAGVTGSEVARSLQTRGGIVSIADDNAPDAIKPETVELSNFDAVVISPGWRQDHPLVVKVLASDLQILNEIDLAWHIRSEISPGQKWLALTGTNGKTTTVEMAAKILQTAGLKAVACGNVGDTVIDAVDRIDPYDYLILELSSFQLHWSKEAQFVSAAILNIADDHLDWHGSFDAYADAKFSILDNSEIAILNADDGEIVKRANRFTDRKVFFSLETPAPGEIGVVENLLVDRAFVADPQQASMICELADIKPAVPHNVSNALAAAALARSVGVSHEVIQKALQEFRPGRHRIEVVFESDSISWVDDSKATNPHAAAASLMSHLSVVWIAGGLAKGADMNSMIQRCKGRIKAAVLIGADRQLISDALTKFAPEIPQVMIDSPADYLRGGQSNGLMEEVVKAAQSFATKGDTVLMAPACASMDQFISYADRGDRFAAAVNKLVAHE